MRVVIAGSRSINDLSLVEQAIAESRFEITEVVSGCAAGPDSLAIQWANENEIPVKKFPADWNNLSHPDAIIKTNKFGKKFDAFAGHRRNRLMSDYSDALIAVWDNRSSGTKFMIEDAKKKGLKVYVKIVN